MNRLFLFAAISLSGVLAFSSSAVAEITDEDKGITIVNPADLLEMEESHTVVLEEEDVPSTSVPEPATFGVIAMAMAVGGGLMIRRKTD